MTAGVAGAAHTMEAHTAITHCVINENGMLK